MNLKDLKYLVALADTGHFGRAAERTFVSQPTLSAQLKKLEDYLGVKLVERQPKNVQLTEVGRQIVVRARRMLNEGDEIVALARDNTNPLSGKLKIALIPTIGPYLLPRVMQKIRKAMPDLKLMLYEHQTENLLKRLRDGELDVGVVALPVDEEGLESRELYKEAFMVALPSNHPLERKSTIKVQDLKDQTLLLLEDGHCLRDQALEVCSRVAGARARGFSRDQPRDPAADGGGGARHHADAGVRARSAVRIATRIDGASVRQAHSDAHRRRRVAQDQHALNRHNAVCDVVHDVMSAKG